MRKLLILFISVIYLLPKNVKAQDEAAVAAVAGGLLAIGAGIAAVEQMKEQAELTATEWFLTNHPEYNQFYLKTLDFDGKKLKDMSASSVITFKIKEFEFNDDNEPVFGSRLVLFGFTSYGWINEYGINFDKVKWFLINVEEWMNMMSSYSKVASGISNDGKIRESLKNGKVVNRGIRVKDGEDIDFYKIDGDMYLVTEYSPEMKFIYNERSLGIYLKETMNLIQIGRGDIIKIHEFFLEED